MHSKKSAAFAGESFLQNIQTPQPLVRPPPPPTSPLLISEPSNHCLEFLLPKQAFVRLQEAREARGGGGVAPHIRAYLVRDLMISESPSSWMESTETL